jgi:sRNA-binding carbon storage regulator CsrA
MHGDISLVIADIDGGRVRIGINAPADVKIVRVKQVINKLKQEVVT